MSKSVLESPSDFGTYSLDDDLELSFPHHSLLFQKNPSGQYTFERKTENYQTKQHLDMGSDVKIHICPVLPVNLPEPKTTLLYLDLESPILVGKSVTTKMSLRYPVEIGVFAETDNDSQMVDCFSCNPMLSRFALYGTPTEGHFCKYALSNSHNSFDNFCYAKVNLTITNNLDSSAKVGKVILNASSQDLYYSDGKIIADPLTMTIDSENKATVTSEQISTSYHTSRRIQSKNSDPFVMTGGYD